MKALALSLAAVLMAGVLAVADDHPTVGVANNGGGGQDPFANHVFADVAPQVQGIDAELAAAITPELLTEVLALVPDEWIAEGDRERYLGHLCSRLADRTAWLPGGGR